MACKWSGAQFSQFLYYNLSPGSLCTCCSTSMHILFTLNLTKYTSTNLVPWIHFGLPAHLWQTHVGFCMSGVFSFQTAAQQKDFIVHMATTPMEDADREKGLSSLDEILVTSHAGEVFLLRQACTQGSTNHSFTMQFWLWGMAWSPIDFYVSWGNLVYGHSTYLL